MSFFSIDPINRSDFNQIEGSRRIIIHDAPRQFASLDLGDSLGRYGLSWNGGSAIQPLSLFSPDGSILWLGVDQQLVALSLTDGHLRLSLPLITPLITLEGFSDLIVALTELELLVFNASTCFLCCFEGLPEIADHLSLHDSELIISFIDGNSLNLNLKTLELTAL